MIRVDGLSFRSKPDLLQRHKTSTNKYISIYIKREGKGIKGRIQKEAGKYCFYIVYISIYLYKKFPFGSKAKAIYPIHYIYLYIFTSLQPDNLFVVYCVNK